MIGRRVKSWSRDDAGTVVEWEPLTPGTMTDTLVQYDDGSKCWHASSGLQPVDGQGPLPSRREAQRAAEEHSKRCLRSIHARMVEIVEKPWLEPWEYCEFGKAMIGNAVAGALAELED